MKKKCKNCFPSRGKIIKLLFVMKLIAVLLLGTLIHASASTYSQATKVNLKMKDASLEEVIWKIQEQSEFEFFYSVDDIKDVENLTIDLNNVVVEKVLETCLEGTGLTFEIKHKAIVIKKAPPKKPEPVEEVEQQQKTIKGKVTEENGNPMVGVSIYVKGTTVGTNTNVEGEYTLEIPDDAQILVLSFIGFETKEVEIGEQTIINITLNEAVGSLDEVVVTGYQTISRERATGSFAKIDTEQIEKPASSISERLVGMVAGLQSTTDAYGNIDFEIRGQTSLFADQQPLIVVDGFAIEGNFSSINPNDVESITVLKDAAAASIWGAKSANGVIVITTKKAKKGITKISVSSFVKFSSKLDLDYVNPIASSADVIAYEQQGFDSQFFGGPWGYNSASVTSLGTRSLAVTAMTEARFGRITEAERDATLAQLRNLNNKSQIEDYLLQAPITQQHNINIFGGNDRMLNTLSLMFEDNKDFFKENKTNKYLINYRNKINVTDWMDFEFSGMLQYNKNTHNGVSGATTSYLSPFDMLVNPDGSLIDMSYLHYYVPNLDEFVPKHLFPYSDWSYNPITEINNRNRVRTDLNTRIQTGLNFKIMKGLSLATKIQYELFNSSNKDYYNELTFDARKLVNETSAWNRNYNTVPIQNVPKGGILQRNKQTTKAYNFRNQLNFDRLFGEDHLVNVIVGSEISSRVVEFTDYPDVFGYDDEKLTTGKLLNPIQGSYMWNGYPLVYARYFFNTQLEPVNSFSHYTDRYFSLYANGAYTFNDKYTVTASMRTDASNLITDDPKYRYSPFWSVGLGWQMAKEDFMGKYEWLDRLNVRLTYGYNGNVDKSTSFLPLINVQSSMNRYTHDFTANVSSFGNPSLRWEKSNTINSGFDFSIFQGKLRGSLDIYKKKSTDLIVDQSIPSVNGTRSQKFNNGEMVNKGIEIKLGTTIPLGNDIVWNGSLNFAYNKNEITSFYKVNYYMYNLYRGGTPAYVEGYNANTLWSLRYAGMTNIGTEANPNMQPSFYGIDDEQLTFLGWPAGDAREYESNEGTTVAPITMGFSNSFRISNFDLSFIITAKLGHVFRRQGFNYSAMTGGNTYVNNKYNEIATGDPSQFVPIPEQEYRYYFWDRFHPYLDYLTESASHIRFQEISLAYNLPKNILTKLGLSSLSIYAQANNIGTIIFNDYGEDPEYPMGTLKPQASYTFGLKFNL